MESECQLRFPCQCLGRYNTSISFVIICLDISSRRTKVFANAYKGCVRSLPLPIDSEIHKLGFSYTSLGSRQCNQVHSTLYLLTLETPVLTPHFTGRYYHQTKSTFSPRFSYLSAQPRTFQKKIQRTFPLNFNYSQIHINERNPIQSFARISRLCCCLLRLFLGEIL